MTINPALEAFLETIAAERIWGEILIQPSGSVFTLRHVAERDVPADQLKRISLGDLRKLSMFNASGQFRTLRAAPDLARGWLLHCSGAVELWRALQEFYPGSLPDWFAVQNGTPPTNYREFTARQSGMYRITQLLSDSQAANVTRAACHPRFCLKRRFWTVPGLDADGPGMKSDLPCLEPCAVLLELARKAMRIEQEERLSVQLSRSELESFLAAAEIAASGSSTAVSAGNVGAAAHPRRLQLLIEKFKDEVGPTDKSATESET